MMTPDNLEGHRVNVSTCAAQIVNSIIINSDRLRDAVVGKAEDEVNGVVVEGREGSRSNDRKRQRSKSQEAHSGLLSERGGGGG
jgi:hypothetical protein